MSTKPGRDPVYVLGMALCKQAGIDPSEVLGLTLDLHIGRPAELTVQLLVRPMEKTPEEFKRFRLVPIEEEAEVPA